MTAMAMFDWIVKYINTTLPPIKLFLPPRALRTVPKTAERITASFKATLKFFLVFEIVSIVLFSVVRKIIYAFFEF